MDQAEEDRAVRLEKNKAITNRAARVWMTFMRGPEAWAALPALDKYLTPETKEFIRLTADPDEGPIDATPIDGMRLAMRQATELYAAWMEQWARENGREDLVTPVKDLIQ